MRQRLLMCPPDFFEVEYTINPWMSGQVGKVRLDKARKQWDKFYQTLKKWIDVLLIQPQPHVP